MPVVTTPSGIHDRSSSRSRIAARGLARSTSTSTSRCGVRAVDRHHDESEAQRADVGDDEGGRRLAGDEHAIASAQPGRVQPSGDARGAVEHVEPVEPGAVDIAHVRRVGVGLPRLRPRQRQAHPLQQIHAALR